MSTIPTSWTIANWFIDPVNGNDGYDGVNATFIGGLAGPLKTKAQLIARWGTNAPTLNGINVVITYLSSDTNESDPGIFQPFFANGATLTHTATLPAPSFVGTLLSVTPKNRAANQELRSTFTVTSGAIASGMLLVNTTRGNSRAMVGRNTSGSTWQISQPLALYTPPATAPFPAPEVDTWANGDAIDGYILTNVNLATIGGFNFDYTPTFGPNHIVQQISLPTLALNTFTYVDMRCRPMLVDVSTSANKTILISDGAFGYLQGCYIAGVQLNIFGTGVQTFIVAGGIITTSIFQSKGVIFEGDVIVHTNGVEFIVESLTPRSTAPDTWIFLDGATMNVVGPAFLGSTAVIYGTGTYNQKSGQTTYAGTAVNTFPCSGGLTIGGLTTAYSINNNTLNSNITLTPAHLDAPAGPAGFGGTAFLLSGVAITNGTSTQASALTQAAWFIDPANGFDGYTGTNATFTSGTTGPLKTVAQLFSRWGTLTPLITQSTTITWVNSASVTDPWIAIPILNGFDLKLQGTPTITTTSTIGTFTAAVRGGANTLATITSPGVPSWAALVGSLVHDTTANATFFIHADLGGGVAQITNPVATPLAPNTFTPAPVTLVNGDTIQIMTPPTIYATKLTAYGFGTTGPLLLSQLTVKAAIILYTDGIASAECVFSPVVSSELNVSVGSTYTSCIAPIRGLANVYAGRVNAFGNGGAGTQASNFDGDVIFATGGQNFSEGIITLRSVYLASSFLNMTSDSVILTQTSATYGPSGRCLVWGPGTLNVSSGAQFDATAGGTAVQKFVNTGGLLIDGVATANVWNSSANTYSAPVSTTPGNLDFFGSLQNPTTGSAIHINSVANPNYLTQATWFIDPALGFDGYSGTNATFTSGTTGPVRTWAEVIRRYSTISPRLRQNTTYTFVSSHTDNTDPVYFRPFVENGAFISIQGTLGVAQQIATGVLGTVTAKNRTTPQLLKTVLPAGTYSAGMLIVNSTHSSRAWLYTLVTGTTWNITQPLTPTNPASPSLTATEVDTWTAGDTVTIYQPVAINIADFTPKFTDLNTSTFNNMVTTYQLTVLDPGGVGNDFLSLGTDSSSFDCLETNFQRSVNINNQRGLIATGFVNCFMQGVLSSTGTFTVKLLGGVVLNSLNAGTFNLAGDFILATGAITSTTNLQYTSVYLETGTVLAIGSGSTFVQSGAPRIIWGPGSINLLGTATLTYLAGAGGAAATFLLTGGITINGSTTAYSINNNTLNSNIAITAANLDAPAGPTGFGGTAFLPNGGIITNGVGTQSSALTQTAWFVDPASGSDGYTGTNATFTVGTTGPVKTWAEIIRRYGTNSPRLRQNTTYTFVSSHTDNTDPVYFSPFIENGSIVSIVGTLGAAQQVASGTLSGVVAKNRNTPQLLNATLAGGLAAGQLIAKNVTVQAGASAASITALVGQFVTLTGLTGMTVNSVGHSLTISGAASAGNNGTFPITTFVSATSVKIVNVGTPVSPDANNGSITWVEKDLSRAWIYKNVSGNTWAISQPSAPITIPFPFGFETGSSCNTWANSDNYVVYNPVQVNLAYLAPRLIDISTTKNNMMSINSLVVFDPSGIGSLLHLETAEMIFSECSFQRAFEKNYINSSQSTFPGMSFINCDFGTNCTGNLCADNLVNIYMSAGQIRASLFFGAGLAFNQDIIIASSFMAIVSGFAYGLVYLDTGAKIILAGTGNSGFFTTIIWGPGTINVTGCNRLVYPAGAGQAVATFINAGGITLNGLTTAYSVGSGTGATLNGGIAITPANLDAPQGPSGFGGTAFILGGASITNGNV